MRYVADALIQVVSLRFSFAVAELLFDSFLYVSFEKCVRYRVDGRVDQVKQIVGVLETPVVAFSCDLVQDSIAQFTQETDREH